MEQLRQVGEALGGIQALMAFADDNLRINPRQCRLLADACALAFAAVAGEARAHLRFDERLAKWKPLEPPLRELHRAVRDAEGYVRHCLDAPRQDWWARAAAAAHGADDCVEQHMHNLLWSVAVALEAVEAVASSSSDPDEAARRRLLFAKDYDRDMLDPRLFRQRLGGRYLATQELAARMDMAWKEDRWLLAQHLEDRKGTAALTRHEQRLADLLAEPRGKVHPSSLLTMQSGGDFQIRRRLAGGGSLNNLKEVQWMGESFAMKHIAGVDSAEVAVLASVAHPNVAHCRYCFHDEERREFFLLMDQLVTKDLGAHVREVTTAKSRTPSFPLVVAVDAMLQVARGMEYLHSRNIYHGDLNPSNVLVVKTRQADAQRLHVKVAGFAGQQSSSTTAASPRVSPKAAAANQAVNPCIWYAPEVLEQEEPAKKRTEKADVYSFAMICFELLTGKIPFEDNHLQGENTSKNIRAGERPLFPFQTPKYLTGLVRRCWHADPAQRPAFASVCRVLRYVKRFLVLNQNQPDSAAPPFDYLDIEAILLRRFPEWQGSSAPRVADVPFQMYAYRVMEKEKARAVLDREKQATDSSSDGNSVCGDDGAMLLPDTSDSQITGTSKARSPRKLDVVKNTSRLAGPPQKSRSMGVVRPPQIATRRTPRIKSDGQLNSPLPSSRRRVSAGGHLSDSELA